MLLKLMVYLAAAGGLNLGYADVGALDPKAVVESIFQKAAEQTVPTNEKLQQEINDNIDFSQMASQVLGKELQKRSASEIKWFDSTLKEIITRTVYPEAPKFLNAVKIDYKNVKTQGDSANVASVVRNRGESTDVEYKLRKVGDSWRVVDIAIDGESWVANISEQVRETLKKKNWNGLRERLNNRLAELRSGKKSKTKADSAL